MARAPNVPQVHRSLAQFFNAQGRRFEASEHVRESLRAMISSLVLIGQEEQAKLLRERLSELDQIFRIAKDADAEQSRWISQTLQKHLRPWESAA